MRPREADVLHASGDARPEPGVHRGWASAFRECPNAALPVRFGPTDNYVENRDSLATPKYHVLFKFWKKEGDSALAGLASGAIQDAVWGRGGANRDA